MRERFSRYCVAVRPVVMAVCMMIAVICLPGVQAGEGCDTESTESKNTVSPVTSQVDDETAGECKASEPGRNYDVPSPPLVYVYNRDRVGLPHYMLFEEPADDLFVSPLCYVNQYTSTYWGQKLSERRCPKKKPPGMVQINELDCEPGKADVAEQSVEVHFGWYPGYGKEEAEAVDYDRLMTEDARPTHDHIYHVASHDMTPAMLVSMGPPPPADEATARKKYNEDMADEKLRAIQEQLAELIRQQPDTRAGRQAAAMIDAAGLKVGPGRRRGLYPKDTFFFGGVAITQ